MVSRTLLYALFMRFRVANARNPPTIILLCLSTPTPVNHVSSNPVDKMTGDAITPSNKEAAV